MGESMETVLEATARLRTAGFELDLSAGPGGRLPCGGCGEIVDANVVTVMQTVRFEGDSNPDDEEILAAVITPCGHSGLFSAAYGPTADVDAGEVLGPAHSLSRSNRHDRIVQITDSPIGPAEEGSDAPCWAHLHATDLDTIADGDLDELAWDVADANTKPRSATPSESPGPTPPNRPAGRTSGSRRDGAAV